MSHKIDIPLSELADKHIELDTKFQENEETGIHIQNYDEFVTKLFKPMTTTRDMVHHACTGISGEAGELLDASKKAWVYGKDYDLENIIEELGDIRFYYQALLNMLTLTDDQIITHNLYKLKQRYPDLEYTNHDAIARADKEGE